MRTLLTILLLLIGTVGARAYSWGVLTPDNGGFSVQVPGEPQHAEKRDAGVHAQSWVVNAGNVIVLAGVSDYDVPLDPKQALHNDELSFLREVQGHSDSRKAGSFRGASGRKLPSSVFTFHTDSGWQGKSRIVLDGKSSYQIVVMWKRMLDGAAVAPRVESSFKLLPRQLPPKPDTQAPEETPQ